MPSVVAKGLGRVFFPDDMGQEAIAAAMPKVTQKLSAWHGSPHDFEQFKMSQIGTGEGAQAYGHGLYFAQNKGVAEGYKGALTGRDAADNFLSALPEDAEFEEVIELLGSGTFTEAQEKVIRALDADDWLGFDYPAQAISASYRDLSRYDPSPALADAIKGEGRLFNVNIDATPDELLDWDKPLREQSEKVRNSLQGYIDSFDDKEKVNRILGDNPKGEDIYELEQMMADKASYESGSVPPVTSANLNDFGIKGIQYDDALSRGAEGGTKNYVIFDDKLIDIAKKYGVSLPVAAQMMQGEEAQAGARRDDPISQHHWQSMDNKSYVVNADNSVSTVRTIQVDMNGKPTLIPTVWDGEILSDQDAMRRARKSGISWPTAPTHKELRQFDIDIHKDMKSPLEQVGDETGMGPTLYTPEQNKALADRLTAQGLTHLIPSGDRIEPDEYPKLEYIADFLDENTQTPFGPAFEGISAYLRGFGEDADAKQRAKRAMGAALDLI